MSASIYTALFIAADSQADARRFAEEHWMRPNHWIWFRGASLVRGLRDAPVVIASLSGGIASLSGEAQSQSQSQGYWSQVLDASASGQIRTYPSDWVDGIVFDHDADPVKRGSFVGRDCARCSRPNRAHWNTALFVAQAVGGHPVDYIATD